MKILLLFIVLVGKSRAKFENYDALDMLLHTSCTIVFLDFDYHFIKVHL